MNNCVITLSTGIYWNIFPLHTFYTEYINLIIKNKKFSHAKYVQKFFPSCENCYVLFMYITMCKLLVCNNNKDILLHEMNNIKVWQEF